MSSAKGEKPQSSQVPNWSTGRWRAASRTRSRTCSGVSTLGIDRVDHADEDPLAGAEVLGDDPSTRSGSASLASCT